ncbi:MAG: hypothetical protein ACRDGV_08665 [Candidatus Limnocylindria bacterium]
MPDLSAFGASLAIALLVAVMLWFALGTQRNIRRGNALLSWLQDGLPLLGERTTLRWLGSSVVELRIVQPETPFREAELLVVLEPRDLGALWALAHRRGRRDFLIVRTRLVRAPRFSADLADPASWTMGDVRRRWAGERADSSWSGTWDGTALEARHDATAKLDDLRGWWGQLASASGGVWRVSISPTVPHLEIHLLPPPHGVSSRRLMETVREVARQVAPSG